MSKVTSSRTVSDGSGVNRSSGWCRPLKQVADLPRADYQWRHTSGAAAESTMCSRSSSNGRKRQLTPHLSNRRENNTWSGRERLDKRLWRRMPRFSCQQLVFVLLVMNVLLFFNIGLVSSEQMLSYPDKVFIDQFLSDFGNNDTLTVRQLEELVVVMKKEQSCSKGRRHITAVMDQVPDPASVQICDHSNPQRHNTSVCSMQLCQNASDLLELYSIPSDSPLSSEDFGRLSPALLYQVHNCPVTELGQEEIHSKRPSSISSWGYGFLFVSIINVCSLGGAIVLPFMKSSFYKHILMFMLGLAVGSLAGSGLLFLIPEAFHLVSEDGHTDYIWKATTIMGGIYLFFLIEKFLKVLMEFKKRKRLRRSYLSEKGYQNEVATDPDYGICSVQVRTPSSVAENARMKDLNADVHVEGSGVCSTADSPSISRENSTVTDEIQSNGFSRNGQFVKGEGENGGCDGHPPGQIQLKQKPEIATVAWMIIFGDGLHNFIDGLSIGAAFTESILAGVSVSMAVICEELPHELGDFAILLNSGMSLKKALMYNFLSACMCYIGLVLGIVLGQNTLAHDWIFALAGGMFLYISLVDMLPEMNSAAKEEERKTNQMCSVKVFTLQNAGLLIGYGLILLMALFGHQINFE